MTADLRPVAREALFAAYAADGRTAWIQAAGRSMLPLIRPGDELLVAFGAMPRRRGEIVLFERDGGFVAHRLVAWDRRHGAVRPRAKGDAEPFADDPVLSADVVGVVRAIRRDPAAPASTSALGGRSGASIAAVSWWADRLARAVRRVTRRVPAGLARPCLHATIGVASTTVRLAVVLGTRASGIQSEEGGETR